jgi:hypothetical protein
VITAASLFLLLVSTLVSVSYEEGPKNVPAEVRQDHHVVAFRAIEGNGIHYTASMTPIPIRSADEIVARLPHAARRDLVEWNTGEMADVRSFVMKFIARQVPIERPSGSRP